MKVEQYYWVRCGVYNGSAITEQGAKTLAARFEERGGGAATIERVWPKMDKVSHNIGVALANVGWFRLGRAIQYMYERGSDPMEAGETKLREYGMWRG